MLDLSNETCLLFIGVDFPFGFRVQRRRATLLRVAHVRMETTA